MLYVHGGPHLQYGNALFHELQWLAAQGYVVAYANPRGSKGYGEAHTRAIKGDWGGPALADLEAVTDEAIRRGYADPDRLAIMGGSYGGYMTAWAVGHTDRFACAIADRLVGNLHSMSGTCDFPWSHGTYYRGNAWDDPSDLWRHSPLAFAGRINTPLLIIHSDGDLRCPVGQAEELFAALRLQKKPVEFVRYPAETSHGLSRSGPPDLRLDRLRPEPRLAGQISEARGRLKNTLDQAIAHQAAGDGAQAADEAYHGRMAPVRVAHGEAGERPERQPDQQFGDDDVERRVAEHPAVAVAPPVRVERHLFVEGDVDGAHQRRQRHAGPVPETRHQAHSHIPDLGGDDHPGCGHPPGRQPDHRTVGDSVIQRVRETDAEGIGDEFPDPQTQPEQQQPRHPPVFGPRDVSQKQRGVKHVEAYSGAPIGPGLIAHHGHGDQGDKNGEKDKTQATVFHSLCHTCGLRGYGMIHG